MDLCKFYTKPIDEEGLNKMISSCQNKFSGGYDEMPMQLIKEAKMHLLKPLVYEINSSFVSGIFPKELKIAKVITIFKIGSTNDPLHYQTISILPTLSKIFEQVLYLQLINFLYVNNLFDTEQHTTALE